MRIVWKVVRNLVLGVVGLAVASLLFFTIIEYRPRPTEAALRAGEATGEGFATGKEMTVLTWNTGYAALGDNADFFMDGGTMVRTADRNRLAENLSGMHAKIKELDPDVVFLQEVDHFCDRTFRVDEKEEFEKAFQGYEQAFAQNAKSFYVPYPWPPVGHLDTGIMTMSKAPMDTAERLRLPTAFTWPVRLVQYKRCLLVSRFPLEGSEKQLVMVNLHNDAYDNGDGKDAQVERLASFLQDEYSKGNYVIAGGDFNMTFSNTDISHWKMIGKEGIWQPGRLDVTAFDKGFNLIMDPEVATCRSLDKPLAGADLEDFQFYVIDGFIVSSNVAVMSVKTLDEGFVCSDHNPVLMRFGLKN